MMAISRRESSIAARCGLAGCEQVHRRNTKYCHLHSHLDDLAAPKPAEGKGGESKRAESKLSAESKRGDTELSKLFGKRSLGTSKGTVSGTSVLQKLYPYYTSRLQYGLEDFFRDNVASFDPDSDEMRLCYSQIHADYERIMERYLEEFIAEENLTEGELAAALEGASQQNPREAILLKLIIAQTDFLFFVDLMKQKARGMRSVTASGASASAASDSGHGPSAPGK